MKEKINFGWESAGRFPSVLLRHEKIHSAQQVSCFLDNPGVLMYGMMCVLYTTGTWLLLASYLELPVSATQSTISSIVGMSLAYGGRECVVWHRESGHFPGFQGVDAILLSWLLSPIVAGVASFLVFLALRTFVSILSCGVEFMWLLTLLLRLCPSRD